MNKKAHHPPHDKLHTPARVCSTLMERGEKTPGSCAANPWVMGETIDDERKAQRAEDSPAIRCRHVKADLQQPRRSHRNHLHDACPPGFCGGVAWSFLRSLTNWSSAVGAFMGHTNIGVRCLELAPDIASDHTCSSPKRCWGINPFARRRVFVASSQAAQLPWHCDVAKVPSEIGLTRHDKKASASWKLAMDLLMTGLPSRGLHCTPLRSGGLQIKASQRGGMGSTEEHHSPVWNADNPPVTDAWHTQIKNSRNLGSAS